MLINEKNRYLVIPVSRQAKEVKIYFYSEDTMLRDIIACVNFENPDYLAYYDMKTFLGKNVRIFCELGKFETADRIYYDNKDEIRPKYHFTAKTGWINDPNGMVFYEGKYHLFFQCNPVGTVRGSEHWGHAVSKDLYNWEEMDLALFPDDMGTMFSGSAIEDKNNVLGLKENEHNPLLLFYTASGGERSESAKGKPFTQCMAISVDGGKNFVKYKNNPIIGELGQRSRDPNVVYDEKSGLFIMALFEDKDFTNNYAFFKSKNLVEWTRICELTIPGERVCPDIFKLSDNGKEKWVFCGGHSYYVTADLDTEKGFVNISAPRKFGFGSMYASQTFNNADKIIRLSWARLSTGPMAVWGKSEKIITKSYSQFLNIPTEITLKDDILRVKPLINYNVEKIIEKVSASEKSFEVAKKPLRLYIKTKKNNAKFNVKIFDNIIKVNDEEVKFYNYIGEESVLPYDGDLTIFTDDLGFDIYSGDKYYASYHAISNYEQSVIEINCDDEIEKLEYGYLLGV